MSAEPKRCGAKAKSTGEPCKLPAEPNGRCRYHGGKSLGGPSAPNFRHGRYSKYMPKQLLERTQEFIQDPEIMSLLPNIALTDAGIADCIEQLGDGFGRPAWEALSGAVGAFDAAGTDEDRAAAVAAIIGVARRGATVAQVREELADLQEARRRLVETETKRLAMGQNVISQDQATGLILFLVDVMFQHIADRAVRRAILEDVQSLSQTHQLAGIKGTVEEPTT